MLRILLLFAIIAIAVTVGNVFETFIVEDNNIYDYVIRPEAFDGLAISDAMSFKERGSEKLQSALQQLDIDVSDISRENATLLLKKQLGPEYDMVFWKQNDEYYDAVMQAPYKMYGVHIIIPKKDQWKPLVFGYIFDDKINMISGVKGSLSDFKAWPIQNE